LLRFRCPRMSPSYSPPCCTAMFLHEPRTDNPDTGCREGSFAFLRYLQATVVLRRAGETVAPSAAVWLLLLLWWCDDGEDALWGRKMTSPHVCACTCFIGKASAKGSLTGEFARMQNFKVTVQHFGKCILLSCWEFNAKINIILHYGRDKTSRYYNKWAGLQMLHFKRGQVAVEGGLSPGLILRMKANKCIPQNVRLCLDQMCFFYRNLSWVCHVVGGANTPPWWCVEWQNGVILKEEGYRGFVPKDKVMMMVNKNVEVII